MFRDLLYRARLESALKIKPESPTPFSPDSARYNSETVSAPAIAGWTEADVLAEVARDLGIHGNVTIL
jgi:hypothetical protein